MVRSFLKSERFVQDYIGEVGKDQNMQDSVTM